MRTFEVVALACLVLPALSAPNNLRLVGYESALDDLAHESALDEGSAADASNNYVPVFVMLPLTTITNDGLDVSADIPALFDSISSSNIDGFMVDVWWGLTEPSPQTYVWDGYKKLFDMAVARDWQVQVVSSFHQCGGNVGDDCFIPIPSWIDRNQDIWYKDQSGNHTDEYISLFADGTTLGDESGRTPIQMYSDWFSAFATEFSEYLGTTIVEVMVGMGPAGELRYPSYPLRYWQFCGIGEFQCFDQYALSSLQQAADAAGKPEWGSPLGRSVVGDYNSKPPNSTEFFGSVFQQEQGQFFLQWYLDSLKEHGRRVLTEANSVFGSYSGMKLAGKIAGIHWWYGDDSNAAEATAGYYNANGVNGYAEIADVFKSSGEVVFCFTCLEMDNNVAPECASAPETLVAQTSAAALNAGVPFAGENALPRYDRYAYDQILKSKGVMTTFTYLRLNSILVEENNLAEWTRFVTLMHEHEEDRGHQGCLTTIAIIIMSIALFFRE